MSVPFFSDFTKKTKDFFKRDKYDLGQQVEISNKCSDSIALKTKITNGDRVKTKFIATLKRENGREIEITEDLRKGLSLNIKLPSFYRNIDIESEHSNKDVEVTAKYKAPKTDNNDGWYSGKIVGYYNPSNDASERVCQAKFEGSVGDDELNLYVGGDITVQDKSKHDVNLKADQTTKVKDYTLGFLYVPTQTSQYSVLFKPDVQSNGMEYNFTCYRSMSDKCEIAAKAEGKVDTKLTGFPPVVTLAGGWSMGSNYLQSFVNSRKEWGLAYKVKVSDSAILNLGVSSFLNPVDQRIETQFGYKLQV